MIKFFVNKLKYILWNHGLISAFVFFNAIPLVTIWTYNSKLLSQDISCIPACIYVALSILFVLFGYVTKRGSNNSNSRIEIYINYKYKYFCIFLALFGLAIAYISLTQFISSSELQTAILNGGDISEVREEAGGGGLSGVLKMFSAMPLFVFLSSSSLYLFTTFSRKTNNILKTVLFTSLVCVILKVFLFFDRLSILAIGLVLIYNCFFNKNISKVIKLAAIYCVIAFVTYITMMRISNTTLLDFLGLYFNLGIVNLQILIDSQQHFNYDFTQTFIHPISFVFKVLGIHIKSYVAEHYSWNPAQSFWGFYYVDFHWIGILFMPILGRFIKIAESLKRSSVIFILLYFVFMYCFFSFTVVPIIRSIEFWLMITVSIGINKLISRRNIA